MQDEDAGASATAKFSHLGITGVWLLFAFFVGGTAGVLLAPLLRTYPPLASVGDVLERFADALLIASVVTVVTLFLESRRHEAVAREMMEALVGSDLPPKVLRRMLDSLRDVPWLRSRLKVHLALGIDEA